MSLLIDKQRAFNIPREKLDLFLVRLNMDSDCYLRLEASYIFESRDKQFFEVVVSYYGSYPYVETKLEEFVKQLNGEMPEGVEGC